MRRRALTAGVFALATIVAACSGGGATETSTSTSTTSAATTTTTTLPPGLEPQDISYGFSAGNLAKYDYTETATVFVEAAPLSDEILAEDVFLTVTLSGEIRQLSLAGPSDSTYELIGDLQPREGTVAADFGGFTFSQDLEEWEVEDLVYIFPPHVFDLLGMPTGEAGGAPGFFRTTPSPFDVFLMPGPPLSGEEIDVGDTWTTNLSYSALGSITYRAEIVDEVATDDGYAFSVEYTVEAPVLPIELTLDDAFAITGSAATEEDLASLFPTTSDDAEMSVELTAWDTSGTFLFEPDGGQILEATMDFSVDETVKWTTEEAVDSLEMTIGASFEIELAEAGEASSVERDAMLALFKTDPYELAYAQLYGLWAFDLAYPADEDIEAFFTLIEETRADVFAGFAFADVGLLDDDSDDSALVVAVTTGGDPRGTPTMAEDLAHYWLGYWPERLYVGDTPVFRFTIDGRQWLIWSDQTHLFLASGRDDIARAVMEALIARGEPYLWQTGDCVNFQDGYANASPYAPFGTYGLYHCLDQHTREVIHSEVLPDGPDAPFPDDDLLIYTWETCSRVFYEYVGAHDMETTIDLGMYLPDEDEWARGDRYVACLIEEQDADGTVTVEGRLQGRGEETAVEYRTGTCMMGSFPVPCDDPHDGEIVGILEYPGESDDPLPDPDVISDHQDDACAQALEDYEAEEGDFDIEVWPMSSLLGEWQFGIREYYCVAYATDEDGWLIDVVGSFTDEWEEAPEQIET
jgi:hypothetical protein